MPHHEPLAQSRREIVEIETATELAKRRSAEVGASTAAPHRMTGPAHTLRQCATVLLGRNRYRPPCEADRACEHKEGNSQADRKSRPRRPPAGAHYRNA